MSMSNLFNGYFNEYPYRNIEDTNLDWIFKTYGQIKKDVEDLTSYIATHKVEYAELVARVSYIENELSTFESRVNAEFERLKNDLNEEFNELKTVIETELTDTKHEIEEEFNRAITEFAL